MKGPLEKLAETSAILRQRDKVPVEVVVSQGGHSTTVTRYLKRKSTSK